MKKNPLVTVYLLLQMIILLLGMSTRLQNVEQIVQMLLVVGSFLYIVFKDKDKDKKSIVVYFAFILFYVLFYKVKNHLGVRDTISLVLELLYFPITLIMTIKLLKKTKWKRINITNSLILFFVFCIVLLLVHHTFYDIPEILALLLPISLIYIDKEKPYLLLLLSFLSLLSIYFTGKIVPLLVVTFVTLLLTFHIGSKKKNKWRILPMAIVVLFAVFFTVKMIVEKEFPLSEFFTQKSSSYILLDILVYYLPLLYIISKAMSRTLNAKRSNITIYPYLYSLISLFLLSLCTNSIFENHLLVFLFSIISYVLLEKLDLLQKNLKKDHITVFALHLGYGGIEQYLSSLSNMLESSFKIDLISTYQLMKTPAFEFKDHVKIQYLMNCGPNKEEIQKGIDTKNKKKTIQEFLHAFVILYKKKFYTIEEIENATGKYMITTRDYHNKLVGDYARSDIIKIATEHNYHNNDKKYIQNVVASVENFDYFVLVSNHLKTFYEKRVRPICVYIPNVIDQMPEKTSKCLLPHLISVGRLSKEKGQKDLLDVIKLLKEDYKDIKLYLIGDGEEKNSLTNYIKQNKLEKNVVMTGFLPKNEIELKMLDSSIFVTTSYTESFGLVVLEACSYALPVVAFDSATGVKKLLENGVGVLVQNRDKQKMKEKIEELLENKKLHQEVAKKGYENAKKYLASNVKEEWLEILK